MKRFYYLLFVVACLCFSCKPEEEPKILGSVYGTVTNKKTGNPIQGAMVELTPGGLQKRTGSNGKYEFFEVEAATYSLYVTKSGYLDYEKKGILVQGNDKDKPVDIQLEELPLALTILDDKENEIDTLDFGANEGVIIRSFNIYNKSDSKLSWEITYKSAWIQSISKTEGEIKAGGTQPIDISIDREKLNLGYNSTLIHFESNNGSKELKVIAYKVNVVETKDATDLGALSAVLNANIVRDMNPSISEYGFVYSTLPAPSLTNGALQKKVIGTPKVGAYHMLIDGLTKGTTYYACAYVSNGNDKILGNQISFKTESHTPQISISSIAVQGTSIIVSYRVTDAGIPLQEVGLCWDTDVLTDKGKNYKMFGNEARSYTSTITDLQPNTLYYIRVYAENEEGIVFSDEYQRKTASGVPDVTTDESWKSGTTYLIIGGSVTSEGSSPITRQGICWSAEHDPTIADNILETKNLTDNPFSCKIENLQQGTTYYVRAFAENNNGPGYGAKREIKTAYEPAKLMGYVYDKNSKPIEGATIEENNSYTYTATTNSSGYYEISISLKSEETYKFRAYKDGYEEQVLSILILPGQTTQQDFSLTTSSQQAGSYITMPDGSFMVQTVDLGSAQWYSAKAQCEASTLGGYSDWRLPTLAELKKMYTYRTQIGGFPSRAVTNNNYWCSDEGSRSGYFYYVDFNTGQAAEMPRVNSFKVRAVRSIK